MTHRLTFKAPNRCWYQLPEGGWNSRPWTKQDRLDAQQAGAWFGGEGQHEFADGRSTSERLSDVLADTHLEGLDHEDTENPLSELLGKLSVSERTAIMRELQA